MTANGTAGGSMNPMASLTALLYKTGRLIRRVMLGGIFLVAAGIVALATAFLGILVAIAALMLRFSGRGPVSAKRGPTASGSQRDDQSEPVTLEARQTGEGWTVE